MGPQSIEMTMTYKEGVDYDRQIMRILTSLLQPNFSTPTRLVVIYKTPMPQTIKTDPLLEGFKNLVDLFERYIPRENGVGDEDGTREGVLLRPLEAEAFEKHIRELECYKRSR